MSASISKTGDMPCPIVFASSSNRRETRRGAKRCFKYIGGGAGVFWSSKNVAENVPVVRPEA